MLKIKINKCKITPPCPTWGKKTQWLLPRGTRKPLGYSLGRRRKPLGYSLGRRRKTFGIFPREEEETFGIFPREEEENLWDIP